MRDFVIAKPHHIVAEAHREDEFVPQHGGPELDLGVVFVKPPRMVAMLEDAGLDRVLEIDRAKLMLAGQPRDYLEAQLLSSARALDDRDPRIQRIIKMSAAANGGADFIE